jgi:hypothetical protein
MPEGSSKTGGLSPGTILFILALFGVGTPLMLSTTRPTPSSILSSGKDASATSDENSAEGLLNQFFASGETQFIDKSHAWQHNPRIYPGPNNSWNLRDPRRYDRISFLIATLPDPENPSLRYEFDRYIDSIQRAFSHEYYLLVKSLSPPNPDPTAAPTQIHPNNCGVLV